MSASDPLAFIGQTIADKYRVEELVGRGGMSVVYRAVHIIWKKPVAIKFFNGLSGVPEDQREELLKAFVREGAILTELSTETANIVQARDIGTHTDPEGKWTPYMVLELLQGSSLASVLEQESADRERPWTLGQMLHLLAQAAAALDVAHGMGVTHRDIKPANRRLANWIRAGAVKKSFGATARGQAPHPRRRVERRFRRLGEAVVSLRAGAGGSKPWDWLSLREIDGEVAFGLALDYGLALSRFLRLVRANRFRRASASAPRAPSWVTIG